MNNKMTTEALPNVLQVAHGRYTFALFHYSAADPVGSIERLDFYGGILTRAAHDAGVTYFDMFGVMSEGAESEYLTECKRAGVEPEAV